MTKKRYLPRRTALNNGYAPAIDNPEFLSPTRIRTWRDEEHQRLFPDQYEDGKRVKDFNGNPVQDTLFEARAAATAAIKQVSQRANPEWLAAATKAVISFKRGVQFTTDDLWAILDGTVETHERRAMGAVIRKLAQHGHITETGVYQQSVRKASHGRPIPVWKRT